MYTDTYTEPLYTDTYTEPVYTDTYTVPVHMDTNTEPVYTDTNTEPVYTDTYTEQCTHTHTLDNGKELLNRLYQYYIQYTYNIHTYIRNIIQTVI